MPGPEVTGLISIGIFIAGRLIRLADTARRNREKCSQLKGRVELINQLLTELQSQWTPDPVTSKMLQDLNYALDDGKALVESCQEKRTWSRVFRTQKKARKFDELDKRITRILEMFHIANMILIVKTSRNGAAAANRAPAPAPTLGTAPPSNVEAVARLAASVVQEARTMSQNREEIQHLVQFVEQIANLMQQLQSASLWWAWDDKTRPLLDDLKGLLEQARNILSHQKHPHRMAMAHAFSCAGGGDYQRQSNDEPEQILQVAYKIEYYVQVLPVITMRQINNTDWTTFG